MTIRGRSPHVSLVDSEPVCILSRAPTADSTPYNEGGFAAQLTRAGICTTYGAKNL